MRHARSIKYTEVDVNEATERERVAPLGEAVRRRRHELGLRQVELAELAGCSQRFVHTVEQGKPSLRLDKILDLLQVLGLGFDVVPGCGTIRVNAGATEQSGDPE